MAEHGRPLELDLLKCHICLERLQHPKFLPCHHNFCQECLGTYITTKFSGKMASETPFPCPICRRMTPPVNLFTSKDKVVGQFLSDSGIQIPIHLQERLSEPLYCDHCQTHGHMTNPAKFWCQDMEANFCEICKEQHHDSIHSDCDILKITGQGGAGTNQQKSVYRCGQHFKNKVWYCENHQLLGCSRCNLKDHSRCKGVTTAIRYLKQLKDESRFTNIQSIMNINADAIDVILKDCDKHLHNLVQSQDIALQSITDLRQNVDKRLNMLQKEVDSVVQRGEKKHGGRIT
ncbi:transcription intermediary factor 1-beta-like [Pecten maximus]|uniref:transcription intermediary factor 1-beta-like n=1 Tax=Pecten maximus TaxID=6579 RepID=UPI0014589CEC|nr:transcription intermediary factor 1-beta-like [Pecten maximus]